MGLFCNSGNNNNSNGCGCYGCLVLVLILAILVSILLTILGTALQILSQVLLVVMQIALILFGVAIGIAIVIPGLGSVFYVIKNLVEAIGDAIKSNASHKRHLASEFQNFWYRFGGFFKDLLFRYCRRNADTIKLLYGRSKIVTSRFPSRAWSFLVMLGVAYHAFVWPVLTPISFITYRGLLLHLARSIQSFLTDVFSSVE